jgi:hypothetical protein
MRLLHQNNAAKSVCNTSPLSSPHYPRITIVVTLSHATPQLHQLGRVTKAVRGPRTRPPTAPERECRWGFVPGVALFPGGRPSKNSPQTLAIPTEIQPAWGPCLRSRSLRTGRQENPQPQAHLAAFRVLHRTLGLDLALM